jgi:hypothetical protein
MKTSRWSGKSRGNLEPIPPFFLLIEKATEKEWKREALTFNRK